MKPALPRDAIVRTLKETKEWISKLAEYSKKSTRPGSEEIWDLWMQEYLDYQKVSATACCRSQMQTVPRPRTPPIFAEKPAHGMLTPHSFEDASHHAFRPSVQSSQAQLGELLRQKDPADISNVVDIFKRVATHAQGGERIRYGDHFDLLLIDQFDKAGDPPALTSDDMPTEPFTPSSKITTPAARTSSPLTMIDCLTPSGKVWRKSLLNSAGMGAFDLRRS